MLATFLANLYRKFLILEKGTFLWNMCLFFIKNLLIAKILVITKIENVEWNVGLHLFPFSNGSWAAWLTTCIRDLFFSSCRRREVYWSANFVLGRVEGKFTKLLLARNFLYKEMKCGMIFRIHAAQPLRNGNKRSPTFHSTFSILVITKIFAVSKFLITKSTYFKNKISV